MFTEQSSEISWRERPVAATVGHFGGEASLTSPVTKMKPPQTVLIVSSGSERGTLVESRTLAVKGIASSSDPHLFDPVN